ncbi:YgaP family membrane protein [Roseospirillum parvum]|uniref:Inner membrane protein YgaP-like transmembrane domain-containing protein n=1 Tax=Roseospirillum parvum TaxID=83401 RepID=A0A1G8DK63_9PROT|nr:DUF2892 domain-containing protein [Roseospirillum parvum]SDH58054.1 Protein of unknown function [Roseospirillum parvum]
MSIDRIVFAFAGSVILITVALALFANLTWALWITGLVGLNLLQASFTGFCPLAIIVKKLGAPVGAAFE